MAAPPSTEILFNCIKQHGSLYFNMTKALRYNVKWNVEEVEQWYLAFKKRRNETIYIGICLHVYKENWKDTWKINKSSYPWSWEMGIGQSKGQGGSKTFHCVFLHFYVLFEQWKYIIYPKNQMMKNSCRKIAHKKIISVLHHWNAN